MMTLNEEHAHAIAAAVADYVSAQNVHYRDRDEIVARAYEALVARLTDALNQRTAELAE